MTTTNYYFLKIILINFYQKLVRKNHNLHWHVFFAWQYYTDVLRNYINFNKMAMDIINFVIKKLFL